MVKKVRARKAGGSTSITLPKAMTERLHIEPGDELFVVETEDGMLVTPHDPHFAEVMEAYARGAKRYRNALRELAK